MDPNETLKGSPNYEILKEMIQEAPLPSSMTSHQWIELMFKCHERENSYT